MRKENDVNLHLEIKKWQLGNITKQTNVSLCIVFLSEDQR
jgi:hypothetical protein